MGWAAGADETDPVITWRRSAGRRSLRVHAGFICNYCDSKLLTVCDACQRPFPQPHWCCGTKHGDFICPTCTAQGFTEPPVESWARSSITHVGTHPMPVQCKRRISDQVENDGEAGETSMGESLAALQERMTAMDAKLDRLQEVIVSKLDEALSRVMGGVANGHAH
ncbi:hypothetical protein BV20DRAFT_331669 [Pilatotrama ljubarskyi]|nr:hypothetical protein BV20DRAFT_331669 [Pilatotrama ljubarskyi]